MRTGVLVDDQPLEPKNLADRVKRYSNLRAAERAVTPTVRGRTLLPSYRLGHELLDDLQRLKGAIRDGQTTVEGVSVDDLAASIDRDLDAFGTALSGVISATPMVQFRATLPGTAEQAREEVQALLDFCLNLDHFEVWPRALIDYTISLLATETAPQGRRVIRTDPCQVTTIVEAQAREQGALRDDEVSHVCDRLRAATIDLLSEDDLEPTIRQIRELKNGLGRRLLHPEVLRSVVTYNVATSNRLLVILSAAREFDTAAEATLESLRALDHA